MGRPSVPVLTYNMHVDPEISSKLITLNHVFYQTFAEQFAETRTRLQPGVLRILDSVSKDEQILDLGCGNGTLALELWRRSHQANYIGLDFSPELISIANKNMGKKDAQSDRFTFLHEDLATASWEKSLTGKRFDVILAFAVLHHLPGSDMRKDVISKVSAHLPVGGRFIHSNWQFLNSQRLRARIQPWFNIGLSETDIEPGDYLLDWRRGGTGLRYVHHFTLEELEALAQETGFEILDSFHSDGDGGRLGLYQIWRRLE